VVGSITGCSQFRLPPTAPSPVTQELAWPDDFNKHLGETLTLEGFAANSKLGAELVGDKNSIWIDGIDAWPEGFYRGGDKGKRLRVTGTVVKRDDLPVFFAKPGEPPRQGMPLQSEEELDKAKWRFLLKDATWVVLE
jgi:hypothetical protein